ncbi:MAG: hypothetical protein ABW048_02770 [Sphingobium sp.]
MHDRIFSLLARRQWLDAEVKTELSRRYPNVIRLLRLQRIAIATRRRLNSLFSATLTPQLAT